MRGYVIRAKVIHNVIIFTAILITLMIVVIDPIADVIHIHTASTFSRVHVVISIAVEASGGQRELPPTLLVGLLPVRSRPWPYEGVASLFRFTFPRGGRRPVCLDEVYRLPLGSLPAPTQAYMCMYRFLNNIHIHRSMNNVFVYIYISGYIFIYIYIYVYS